MKIGRILAAMLLAAFMIFGAGCSEPGPAEKVGKAGDETVEKIKHGNEGTLEKTGRKIDESLEDMREENKKEEKEEMEKEEMEKEKEEERK